MTRTENRISGQLNRLTSSFGAVGCSSDLSEGRITEFAGIGSKNSLFECFGKMKSESERENENGLT